jgi:hypothetical protein
VGVCVVVVADAGADVKRQDVDVELLRRAVGELRERPYPAASVLRRRLDEDVDVFRQPDDSLDGEGVAADDGVLDVLPFEELCNPEDIFIRRCTRSLTHRSQSRFASSAVL